MDHSNECRICCKLDCVEMCPLSAALFDGKSSAQVIEDCFGLVISNDELPSLCCGNCRQDLAVALSLMTRICESEIRLKSLRLFPKEERLESLDECNLISSVFIAEAEIKVEESEEPIAPPVKRRGRPKKVKIEKSPQIPTDTIVTDESQNKLDKQPKRRKSVHSMRSDDGMSDFSGESEGFDFEPADDNKDSETDDSKRVNRTFYGVKSGSQPIRCCSCKNYPLNSMEKVRDHSKKFHTRPQESKEDINKPFECTVCFARFETKKEFRQHERKMYVDVLHTCKCCDEQFANPYVLQMHLKKDHQRRLKVHKMEDMCIQSNICCGCREQFESQDKLKEHSLQVHLPQREPPQSENAVECDVCYKSYKSARYLKEHRLRFFKKKNYVCTQCGRSFRERSQLEDHEDSHRNVRKYECPVCHAKFAMKASWLVHVRYHEAEETFHCEYCGKGFRKKGLLKAHMRVHSDDRAFKCSMCPLSFTQKNRFDSHVLEHSGMKSFKCEQCPASYIHQRALRRHVRDKHEGIQSFKCTICPKGFNELKPLLVHLKTHEKSNEASFIKG